MIFLVNALILAAGFYALIKGADVFVDGSAALARKFNVPSLVVGLTIVALGTSAPEMAVSVSAALQGANEIALSNVLGSNIFNILIILGVCAFIFALPVERSVLKRDFPLSIISTAALLIATGRIAFGSQNIFSLHVEEDVATITRPMGMALNIVFVGYIVYLILSTKKQRSQDSDADGEDVKKASFGKCALLIIVGLALIIVGGKAVVYSAREIARAAGMTETLIGLTIVAVGTSLPELAASIVAARKGETGLAIGNAVGSNIFNLLFVLGVSATLRPIAVNIASIYDMTILLAATVLTFCFALSSQKITRWEGIFMILFYAAYVTFTVVR